MRIAFLLISIAISISACCQNYFKDGVKWICQELDYVNGHKYYTYSARKCLDNGEESLGMFISSETEPETLKCYIKTDGEKVYFKPIGCEKWYLLYDFDLKQGVPCITNWGNSEADNVEYYSNRVMLVENKDCPYYYEKFIMMELKCVFGIADDSDSGRWVWVKGIGSCTGPLGNIYGLLGNPVRLLEVWDGETLICNSKCNGVSEVLDSADLEVRAEGNSLVISGSVTGSSYLYSSDGTLIASFEFNGGEKTMTLPQPGFYIVRVGDIVRKIMAR